VPAVMARPRRRWPILSLLGKILRNWTERHQLPLNRWLHLLGIPLAVAGVVLLFYLPWYCGAGTLVLGYVLQYLGHQAEGNDVGEWAAIKGLFGLPCVSIAPRWQQRPPAKA
jgi:Protein of unknown function (DUF962)